MSVKEFRVTEGSAQCRFLQSSCEIAGFTGGYGNGKSAGLCVDALSIATSYENGRILIGRATRPKLEDSTKPEMLKWISPDWVESWPNERKNNIVLKNGTRIEFRHIRQEGKGKGEEQSNILSSTYDYIGVDQIDDPEFGYKDYADLFGRLRGTAKYIGDDPKMPKVGPQRLRFTANPTRNWLFREVVNPYFIWLKSKIITEKFKPMFLDGRPIIEIFNAPTSANSRNTGERYAQRMRAVFRGSMGKRYIEGDWGAYEGLVYPDFDETVHVVHSSEMEEFIKLMIIRGEVGVLEGYDYGQAVPSCYGLAFVDTNGDVFLVDGFYQAGFQIDAQARRIKEIRNKWGIIPTEMIFADPDLFKKKHAKSNHVGQSIAELFGEQDIHMQSGANIIDSGIAKVSSYLQVDPKHKHPIKGVYGSPRLHLSSDVEWCSNEFADYYWNKNITGLNVDKPRDINDHAMDMIKYMFTKQAKVIGMIRPAFRQGINPIALQWNELDQDNESAFKPRHRSY